MEDVEEREGGGGRGGEIILIYSDSVYQQSRCHFTPDAIFLHTHICNVSTKNICSHPVMVKYIFSGLKLSR